jgi:NADH dehydrogenase FAD-containing subunit
MLTLGDTDASINSMGGWVRMSGILAALFRRLIYAYRMPTLTQTLRALLSAGVATTRKVFSTRFTSSHKHPHKFY